MKREWREKCEDMAIFIGAIAVIVWAADLIQFLRITFGAFKWMR